MLQVCRLAAEISDEVEEDPTGGKTLSGHQLNGAPNKLQQINQFHVGEPVLALAKTELQAGGQEVLLYGTVMGGLGAMLPFTSREDVDFFSHLEMHLRQVHAWITLLVERSKNRTAARSEGELCGMRLVSVICSMRCQSETKPVSLPVACKHLATTLQPPSSRDSKGETVWVKIL